VQTGHAHRVLVGVGAAVGEEDPVQLARRVLGDQPRRFRTRVVGMLWRDRAQLDGLRLNGRHHVGMLVADVGEHQLR
jgi:hypothetical protein